MNRTVRLLLFIALAGLLFADIGSSAQETPNRWAPFEFLLGDWVGEGGGQQGQGEGEFSFRLDLQNHILVRKNYAAYPLTNDRPAFRHDDLLIVYRKPEDPTPKAVYFDSEGHVIYYSITFSSDQKTIEFVSDVQPSSPRYRFTYIKTGSNSLALKFEIAPAGKPGAFKTYIEAKARRK